MEEPPKKGKGKGKGKAKQTDTSTDEQIIFDNVVAKEQEKVTWGALYSITLIDLQVPPLPIKQGPWNQ